MGSSFVLGHKQISHEELEARHAAGELEALDTSDGVLETTRGPVSAADLAVVREGVPGFQKIGPGNPLSLQILTVYTGDPPGKRRDLLITSGHRAAKTFDAAQKMLNQIVKKAEDHAYLEPSAFDQGSPIVYYTKSVTDETILCSFQLASDRFDEQIFTGIKKLFSQAAGLPVFLPAQGYLLAGSVLTTMARRLTKAIFEGKPLLDADLNLHFNTPNVAVSEAQSAVLYNDSDRDELSGLDVRQVGNTLALVDANGKRYKGAAPYMIVNIDGRDRPQLEEFGGQAVSSAMLSKFYGGGSPTQEVLGVLGTGLKLYNDSRSRDHGEEAGRKLEDLAEQIKGLDPKSADFEKDYAELKKQFDDAKVFYDAWNKKIEDEKFKLPAIQAPAKPTA